jgi:hypothetical protein
MATWVWILIAIAAVVVIGLIAMTTRQRRTTALRERFGPEYDRTVEAKQDRRGAEAELRERERQRAQLDIRPLPEDARARYAQEWRDVQEQFVDQPAAAVVAADGLVHSVMEARGYPMGDFDAQADLVSVDHPEVVDNFRSAHAIHERVESQETSTEDLREALVRYRSLFDELLGANNNGQADVQAGQVPGSIADQTDRRVGVETLPDEPAVILPDDPTWSADESDEPTWSADESEVSDERR